MSAYPVGPGGVSPHPEDILKWRIQRESFAFRSFDPVMPVWAAYPPRRWRPPYLFTSWAAAMAWADGYPHA